MADISSIGRLLSGSALTDDVDVPHGHYAAENMAVSVVPNRNAIMFSIAYGVAVARGARIVAAAVHAGDQPRCRPHRGLLDVFDAFEVGVVYVSGDPKGTLSYNTFVRGVREEGFVLGGKRFVLRDTWGPSKGRRCTLGG